MIPFSNRKEFPTMMQNLSRRALLGATAGVGVAGALSTLPLTAEAHGRHHWPKHD